MVDTAPSTDTADISAGVTFSLGGADAALFSIDSGTGAVTLTGNPNFEGKSSYSFTVLADDGVNTPTARSEERRVGNQGGVGSAMTSGGTAGAYDDNRGAE